MKYRDTNSHKNIYILQIISDDVLDFGERDKWKITFKQ